MNQGHLLGVLYDITATMGLESRVESLLTRTLQRLLFHTGDSSGCVLLREEDGTHRLAAAVGDGLTRKALGSTLEPLRATLLENLEPEDLQAFPCRQGVYRKALHIAIEDQGVLMLFTRHSESPALHSAAILQILMSHLARQIKLCRVNNEYTSRLERAVEERTAALQASEARIRQLMESTAEGIYGIDPQGICTFANASCVKMLGYERASDLEGRILHHVFHHHDKEGKPISLEACAILRACRAGHHLHIEEDRFWRRDGTPFPVELRSFPVYGPSGELLGGVVSFLDITEDLRRRKADEEFREKMEQSQRLESLGLLAGGLAHDFNNLLVAILGNTELLRSLLPNADAATLKRLQQIEMAGHKAADLCHQMLAYSGRGRFLVAPIQLSTLVGDMLNLLQVGISKRIELRLDLAPDLPMIEADLAQIQQVVLNLITNAAEAIGDQPGLIRLRTGLMEIHAQDRGAMPFDQEAPPGHYVCLEVEDTGCGMSREVQGRIFEPFFTTKFTGRGLGMSAVLGIMRSHKGAILVNSKPGQGSCFKVLFPVAAVDKLPSAEASKIEPSAAPPSGGTFLVVDDEAIVLSTTSSILESFGLSAITAHSGQEAIELLKQKGSIIDGALLDLTMPGLDGAETHREFQRIRPGLPVILLSGFCEEEVMRDLAHQGFAGFLQKPYRSEALKAAVMKLLEKKN
ncbi:MAG: response regulator [Firmicutes bacterium]|nr:response regulator [Bacillota bacterium]